MESRSAHTCVIRLSCRQESRLYFDDQQNRYFVSSLSKVPT